MAGPLGSDGLAGSRKRKSSHDDVSMYQQLRALNVIRAATIEPPGLKDPSVARTDPKLRASTPVVAPSAADMLPASMKSSAASHRLGPCSLLSARVAPGTAQRAVTLTKWRCGLKPAHVPSARSTAAWTSAQSGAAHLLKSGGIAAKSLRSSKRASMCSQKRASTAYAMPPPSPLLELISSGSSHR